MLFGPQRIPLKSEVYAVLRNADPADAEQLIRYMKTTTAETPFLLRNPEEIYHTIEEERAFIRRVNEAERDIMLLAELNGVHAGNASLLSLGSLQRTRHRCSMAIALYKDYWGLGLGHTMLNTLLEIARQTGYEQAELQVCTSNTRAIALYRDLGFTTTGILPRSMKYPDGSYADEYTMIKRLDEDGKS